MPEICKCVCGLGLIWPELSLTGSCCQTAYHAPCIVCQWLNSPHTTRQQKHLAILIVTLLSSSCGWGFTAARQFQLLVISIYSKTVGCRLHSLLGTVWGEFRIFNTSWQVKYVQWVWCNHYLYRTHGHYTQYYHPWSHTFVQASRPTKYELLVHLCHPSLASYPQTMPFVFLKICDQNGSNSTSDHHH